jgi:hypothetical protein
MAARFRGLIHFRNMAEGVDIIWVMLTGDGVASVVMVIDLADQVC